MTPARTERSALCDTLMALGPEAPTLCEGWAARDLAAHLVLRETRPDAAAGVLIGPLAGHTRRVQEALAAGDWATLVERVRSGPPAWSPTRLGPVDRLANTVEMFIHHEDLRRAGAHPAAPRDLPADLVADLTAALKRMARVLARKVPVGLALAVTSAGPDGGPADTGPVEMVTARRGSPQATLSGPVGELWLYMSGRRDAARVRCEGSPDAIAAVRAARLGY